MIKNKVKAFYEFNTLDKTYDPINQLTITKYQPIFPKFLLNIWRNYGVSSHKDGFFWLVNPDDYIEVINQFIPNRRDLYVVVRTAFGGLIYYDHKAKEAYNYLCPIYRQVTSLTSNLAVVMNGWLTTEEICVNLMFYSVYAMARQILPRPESDECYGFVPAIALGGDFSPNNVKTLKMKEHLSFLSQLR